MKMTNNYDCEGDDDDINGNDSDVAVAGSPRSSESPTKITEKHLSNLVEAKEQRSRNAAASITRQHRFLKLDGFVALETHNAAST
jgi:hypothetical protein